ncbi:MAG: hypothetical protein Harvfovirus2_13 [Harvfovirus sp.]|uniref:Leucine-rich repeat protein n=1 Tax=Harvfovirus sp. TaxID=2487768 RepID=A0A3G5A3S5_9VIRU|nr:MAG: hypothetical protein Harvfovirus2_13 [Harvfovirus sp.]
MTKFHVIPLTILVGYLENHDIIKLTKIEKYLRDQIYNNVRPTFLIETDCMAYTMLKLFKNPKFTTNSKSIFTHDTEILNKIIKLNIEATSDKIILCKNLTHLMIKTYSEVIQQLTNLKSLYIRDTTALDMCFTSLTNLTYFSADTCHFLTDSAISELINLQSLELIYCSLITNDALLNLTKLNNLKITINNNITHTGLLHLTALTTLDLINTPNIHNDVFLYCKNLQFFTLCYNTQLTHKGINILTNLKSLVINDPIDIISMIFSTGLTRLEIVDEYFRQGRNNYSMIKLLGLRELSLSSAEDYDHCVCQFTNLTSLSIRGISDGEPMTNGGLRMLTNLKNLELFDMENINDEGICTLTKLTSLSVVAEQVRGKIIGHGLLNLQLKKLDIPNHNKITNEVIAKQTNLTSLNISSCPKITGDALSDLVKLKHLEIRDTLDIGEFIDLSSLVVRAQIISVEKYKRYYERGISVQFIRSYFFLR